MEFSEKLMELRRREGLSQEQLADRLGVTRQSVSKWESGSAMPELNKLIAISDIFGVTIDYLVKEAAEPEQPAPAQDTAHLERRLDDLAGEYHRSFGPYYSYTSKVRLLCLPLVSVRFGRDRHPSRSTTAIGIIAVGNFAVGVVSVGMISLGLFSLGMIAFGGVSLGLVALGGLACGVSAGGLAVRGIAAANLFGK